MFALLWSDVDFDNSTISINKQIRTEKNEHVFSSTKSSSSFRILKVGEEYMSYLKELKKRQEENEERYQKEYTIQVLNNKKVLEYKKSKYLGNNRIYHILIKEDGKEYLPTTFSNHDIKRIRKKSGVNFHFHQLRHHGISDLISFGVDIASVSHRAGHSNPSITLSVYTHRNKEKDDKVASLIPNVLEGK